MAEKRQIDEDAKKFYLAIAATVLLFFGPLFTWTAISHGGINVAFVASLLITFGLAAGIIEYARRHPDQEFVTWGLAMLAATYVFLLMFFAYGIVPHQWLTWADNEMNWRPDRFVAGPSWLGTWGSDDVGIFQWILPFDLTYQVLRDIVVVTLYGLALAGNVWMWSIWQNRGNVVSTEVETTVYGRPLQKV